MARLILKCPYLKGGSVKAAAHLDHLVKYIATREGVEKIKSGRELWPATKNQQALVQRVLKEFPDSKGLLEYEDYLGQPNRENASEFITIALEQHLDRIADKERYLDYIANRPRVERFDTHGLFTAGEKPLVLSEVSKEVSEYTGNVWTPIISLRREDAETFGFENATAWKALVSAKALAIAESLKIHPDHFQWYAAFHNESHHPHIHMICYSTDPREGYLTKQGIRKMKSALATEIFRQELIPLYGEKTQRRDEITRQTAEVMWDLVKQMQDGVLQNDKIEQLITHLAEYLKNSSGKKQYGYLNVRMKNVVDEIVDELAHNEKVAAAYRLWQETKGMISSVYNEKTMETLPLSKCEEFKPIRNMIIKEALGLKNGCMSYEEPASIDTALSEIPPEKDDPADNLSEADNGDYPVVFMKTEMEFHEAEISNRMETSSKEQSWWSEVYKLAKQHLHGDEVAGVLQDFEEARKYFVEEAEKNNPLAMYELGRMSADGLGCEADPVESHQWYEKALDGFYEAEIKKSWKYTEYRLGKMYAAGLGTEQDDEQAAYWLNLSAEEGYKYAQYSLGGLYYHGKGVEQDYQRAFSLYTRSAEQGFPYASFECGKMLRDGIGCIKNNTIAEECFREAFQGFFELEKSSHDDKLQYRLGWMLLNGVGTEKDISKAWKYLESAASVGNPFACYQFAKLVLSEESPEPEQVEKALDFLNQSVEAGNSSAQYFLGKLYEKGQHVPENAAEAVRLYTLAAEQGNDFAAYRLGKFYLGGEGILKDVERALHWLNFAAEKRNSFAEYALGILYLKGEDVSKDSIKAVDFLNEAAEKDNEFAQYRLGKVYLVGEDVPKDVDKALQYLTAAAEQGNQYAQYTLGKLYLMGKDIPRDKEAAVKWFTLSAEQGNIYARFFLDHIDQWREPSVLLATTRLLQHMSRVFADNIPPRAATGQNTDRKLLQKLREKKQAQGHARDEHGQVM